MRVVSEPLRKNWEERRFNRNSLLTLKKSREDAIILKAKYEKQIIISLLGIGFLWVIPLIVGMSFKMFTTLKFELFGYLIALLLLGLIVIKISTSVFQRKVDNEAKTIKECDQVFEDFGKSVATLNPLGTGNSHHDLITEDYVVSKLENLAYRLLDAEITFDRTCRRSISAVDRNAIMVKGEWIKKCQTHFDGAWDAATNHFGLKLDKQKIFRDAAAEMTRDELKSHPSS